MFDSRSLRNSPENRSFTVLQALDVAGREVQGTTHSFMSLFQQVFTLPAPIISGFIVEAYGIVPVFYCSSALLFLAATVWVFIRIPRVEG